MKIMLSETVIHYHEVELSDELNVEKIVEMANEVKQLYDTGYEAVRDILSAYQTKFGQEFDFTIKPNACGTTIEKIEIEEYY